MDIPNSACNDACDTDKFTRSKNATTTPNASRKAIRHRLRGIFSISKRVRRSGLDVGFAEQVSLSDFGINSYP
jgi:hypothetical protein